MLGILQPVVTMNLDSLYQAVGEMGSSAASDGTTLQAESKDLWKSFIEEQLDAYVLDKAKELGADVSVTVSCAEGSGNTICPESVTVTGTLNEKQRKRMTELLEKDLGVPAEKQRYDSGDEP